MSKKIAESWVLRDKRGNWFVQFILRGADGEKPMTREEAEDKRNMLHHLFLDRFPVKEGS